MSCYSLTAEFPKAQNGQQKHLVFDIWSPVRNPFKSKPEVVIRSILCIQGIGLIKDEYQEFSQHTGAQEGYFY